MTECGPSNIQRFSSWFRHAEHDLRAATRATHMIVARTTSDVQEAKELGIDGALLTMNPAPSPTPSGEVGVYAPRGASRRVEPTKLAKCISQELDHPTVNSRRTHVAGLV